jgi:N-formylglutamate amidohydrolase
MPVTAESHTLARGSSPQLISIPHVATTIPINQQHRYTPRALASEDTDWFLNRLYAFAADRSAALIVPTFSRYLIDLNRSCDNAPMYPGQCNTDLCPTRHFTGDTLYRVDTASGASSTSSLSDAAMRVFSAQSAFSHVLNGRFNAGHIARRFGRPVAGIHAIQLEMCWRACMDETPRYLWNHTLAACTSPLLRASVTPLKYRHPHYHQHRTEKLRP